jgi:anti-sigma regulatory factor (Ser/Thr protein kinase)
MDHVTITVPSAPEGPARARAALEPLREAMPSPAFGDLSIVVSELVADAALAAEPDGDAEVAVEIDASDGAVNVEVRDGEGAYRLGSSSPRPGEHGFGLRLAQQIADRWSVRRHRGRAIVRIELCASGA